MNPFASVKAVAGNVYGAATRIVGGMWTKIGGWGFSRVRLFAPGSRHDWEREAGDPWSNSVVALAIQWLGDRFSRPRMRVSKIGRKGDYTPLDRHAMTDLWARPNKFYSRRTMEKAVGLSIKCDGNAFIYKVRNKIGSAVVELWFVPYFRCFPTWPPDGSAYIDGYRIVLDDVNYWVPAADMIHIRDGLDPRNERLGLAALKAQVRELCVVNSESSYTAGLMKNSGVPGLAIIPDGDGPMRVGDAAAERMKETFGAKFGGDMVGSTVVMAGKYRIEPVGFSPEQLRLDKLPQNAMARLASAIGVALMSMNLKDEGKTYANLGEANKTSWGTIVAIQELVAESLRYELLPEFGLDPHAYAVDYDYSHIQELQESLDSLHARNRDDWEKGVITQNEAREQIGYEPDPDGDRYFPGTGSPADAAAAEHAASLIPEEPDPADDEEDDPAAVAA